MKRKIINRFLAVLIIVFALTMHVDAIVVSPTGTHFVADTLTFRPTSSSFANVFQAEWDFGDGNTTIVTSGLDSVTNSYNTPGIYTVTVVGRFQTTSPITETTTVVIENRVENRFLEVTPAQPVVGQPATFRAFNFITPDSIVWDMGDGTILRIRKKQRSRLPGRLGTRGKQAFLRDTVTGTSVVTHTYTAPGSYTVRALDFAGDTNRAVTLRIVVVLPPRSITFLPAQPLAGAPVQFNAVNFL
ncbi:MAG: PKD domain-containing protein, partial [bacterium]|nr:PKD domain-containing protein [bacterium]